MQWVDLLGNEWTGPLRVRVRGKSMYPTLRPGDVVIVEPAELDDLRPGDVVLCRDGSRALLHRLMGRTPEGWLITQGDAHSSPDPPWPQEALLGKAVGVVRGKRVAPIPYRPFLLAIFRGFRRAVRLFRHPWLTLVIFLLTLLLPALVLAAVTLVSFNAIPQGQAVLVQWETASEVNMLGFIVWRAESEEGGRTPISDLIPATGDIIGASYQFTDTSVEPGKTYFYWLEAKEVTGASEFHGPVSVIVPLPGPSTPTPSFTPTPTSTPPATPTPTRTPTATPTFTPSPTHTPTVTPTFTPSPSPTLSPSPSPTMTRTPFATPSPKSAPSPSPTVKPPAVSTPVPPPSPTFTSVPSPTREFVPSNWLSPLGSPTTRFSGPVTTSPPLVQTPRPAGVAPAGSLPTGLVWVLLGAGVAVGSGMVLWGILIILQHRRLS